VIMSSDPPAEQPPASPPAPSTQAPTDVSGTAPQDTQGELPPDLPVTHESILDADTLNQLFEDVSQCTHLIEVIVKYGRHTQTPDANHTLAEAKQLLADGSARGIQLRYQYDGAQWWDTLMRTPAGTRIVRIRHDTANM